MKRKPFYYNNFIYFPLIFSFEEKHGGSFNIEVLRCRLFISQIDFDNDGIGKYEFAGAKCFDAGNNYVSDFIIETIEYWNGNFWTYVPNYEGTVDHFYDTGMLYDFIDRLLNAKWEAQMEIDYRNASEAEREELINEWGM